MADLAREVMLRWHADTAHLRDMMRSEGWERYIAFVEKVEREVVEQMLSHPPGFPTDFERGMVAGLRRALQIPQEVIKNTEATRAH